MIDLRLDHVSKRYFIRHELKAEDKRRTLLKKLSGIWQRPEEFWALRDVSFEVRRGEALGIIGHNGAGKSTILKLLANITRPSAGKITINGKLSALIEVGSGFHPELTGRENVYLSGSILGMRRSEISRKLDSIIDFAGIHQFIDTPVKRYSSGMYVRLGFSIAAHLEPDILLLDEVLAVGDGAFQLKCMKRIQALEQSGKTIVFISHDLKAIERLCDRVILLEHGQVGAVGTPREVIQMYEPPRETERACMQEVLRFENPKSNPSNPFEVETIEALDREDRVKRELATGEYVRFKITWRSAEYIADGGVELGIHTLQGVPLIRYSNQPVSGVDISFNEGQNSIELEFERFPLAAGEYIISTGLTRPNIAWLSRTEKFAHLVVKEADIFGSGYLLDSSYSIMTVSHRWLTSKPVCEAVLD
jgi:lipopolysaccharide transport system ATP-binding protein